MRDFMTVQEAAIRWGVTERQVQMLCKNEKLKVYPGLGETGLFRLMQKSQKTVVSKQESIVTTIENVNF